MKIMITYQDFENVDIRVGRILDVKAYPEGKYSSHILKIDFGSEVGVKTSLARLIPNYEGKELIGRDVLAAVNLTPKKIGKHISEVLILGLPDEERNVVLVHPDRDVPLGSRLY